MRSVKKPYQKPKVRSGDFHTPVTFFKIDFDGAFSPVGGEPKVVYACFAQVYAPSAKDQVILSANDKKEGVTIKIRDTQGQFVATPDMTVKVDHYQYLDKTWEVVDTRPDYETDRYDVIVLGNPSVGGDS